jgi:hypothetical protein
MNPDRMTRKTRRILRIALCGAGLVLLTAADAGGAALQGLPATADDPPAAAFTLPELSEPDGGPASLLALSGNGVEIGYDSAQERLLATAAYDDRALAIGGHYGLVLTRRLASSVSASFGDSQKEVTLNNVLTFGRRTRLRVSIGQLLHDSLQDGSEGARMRAASASLPDRSRREQAGEPARRIDIADGCMVEVP